MISIHDPIHGTIDVTPIEIKLVDSRPFQRLRHIKQLGFSHLAFPGATHTRYAHSLGAMQMATTMAEKIMEPLKLSRLEHVRLRQMLRLAVLFHDIGHAPFSHVTERVMPSVAALNIGDWVNNASRQATHEDYTVKLLVDSELTDLIHRQVGDLDISGEVLAALVMGTEPPGQSGAFIFDGKNLLPLMHQIVSGEMDADRMDYLRRDAYCCGVSYGQFDHMWLTANLTAVEEAGKWQLALKHRGVWAFENFLLARYHMFLAVYLHHTPVCFDNMLGRFFESGEYELPGDTEGYLQTDDVHLTYHLRQSTDRWAQCVANRRPYRMLVEQHNFGPEPVDSELDLRLKAANVNYFKSRSKSVLSKYVRGSQKSTPLMVLEPEIGRISPIEQYTPLFERFATVTGVNRVYCEPGKYKEALQILTSVKTDLGQLPLF